RDGPDGRAGASRDLFARLQPSPAPGRGAKRCTAREGRGRRRIGKPQQGRRRAGKPCSHASRAAHIARMIRSDKAARIMTILDGLSPQPPIPLDHVDPFTMLVAVVLSAQTTDKKVNQVTPELFRQAPNPQAMAALPVPKIQSIIREVGLAPQK